MTRGGKKHGLKGGRESIKSNQSQSKRDPMGEERI